MATATSARSRPSPVSCSCSRGAARCGSDLSPSAGATLPLRHTPGAGQRARAVQCCRAGGVVAEDAIRDLATVSRSPLVLQVDRCSGDRAAIGCPAHVVVVVPDLRTAPGLDGLSLAQMGRIEMRRGRQAAQVDIVRVDREWCAAVEIDGRCAGQARPTACRNSFDGLRDLRPGACRPPLLTAWRASLARSPGGSIPTACCGAGRTRRHAVVSGCVVMECPRIRLRIRGLPVAARGRCRLRRDPRSPAQPKGKGPPRRAPDVGAQPCRLSQGMPGRVPCRRVRRYVSAESDGGK